MSSDGLNDEERAQIEAVHAAARARKQRQKVATSPLSSETLRPLLKKMVAESIESAITPMTDRIDRQDESIQDLRSRVTSIGYVVKCIHSTYYVCMYCLNMVWRKEGRAVQKVSLEKCVRSASIAQSVKTVTLGQPFEVFK